MLPFFLVKKFPMKKLLLSVLEFSTLAANAQYVVTNFHTPVIGDVQVSAVDTFPSVQQGPIKLGICQQ
jgi:hypothetical protein